MVGVSANLVDSCFIRRNKSETKPVMDRQPADIVFYDIGARLGANYMLPEWFNHMRPASAYTRYMRKVAFEPDEAECTKLLASGQYETALPYALAGTDGTRTLFVLQEPTCSSLFPPDMAVVAEIFSPDIAQKFSVVRKTAVEVRNLDSVAAEGLPMPDWLKLDTQGAEHEILTGAPRCLQHASVIIAELSSIRQYAKQPLAYETQAFLATQGFHLLTCNYKPHCPTEHDFVFVKNFSLLSTAREYFSVLLLLSLYGQDIAKASLLAQMRQILLPEEMSIIEAAIEQCENQA